MDAYIALVGLTEQAHRYPALLSGGERQRAALARALAVEPAIMYVDEPFNALDASARVRIRNDLREIWRRHRRTILFVTHDVEEAEALGTRRIILARPTPQIATTRPAGTLRCSSPDPPIPSLRASGNRRAENATSAEPRAGHGAR